MWQVRLLASQEQHLILICHHVLEHSDFIINHQLLLVNVLLVFYYKRNFTFKVHSINDVFDIIYIYIWESLIRTLKIKVHLWTCANDLLLPVILNQFS
jgi:hypothetical protein